MGATLEIEEYGHYGFYRLRYGGWPYVRRFGLTTAISGIIWAGLAALLLGLNPDQGWHNVSERWDALLLFFVFGIVVRLVFEARWRKVVVQEDGLSVTSGGGGWTRYPRDTVRQLSVRCWAKNHRLTGQQWDALIEVQWSDHKKPPLMMCGPARGVEASTKRLPELYPAVELDVPPLPPGVATERQRAEQERAEIAALQRMGRRRFCLLYGVVMFGLTWGIAIPVLTGFFWGWDRAIGYAIVFTPLGLAAGYVFGRVMWRTLAQRAKSLDRDAAL